MGTRKLDRCVLRHKYGSRKVSRIYKSKRKQRLNLELKRQQQQLLESGLDSTNKMSLFKRISNRLRKLW